jgi:hypothetical protein
MMLAALAAALPAQTRWQLRCGDAPVRLAGAAEFDLHGPRAAADDLPAGDYEVHFGADAAGKPMSLAFAVPPGASVHIATAAAPVLAAQDLVHREDWERHDGGQRLRGGSDGAGRRDYRVEAAFVVDDSATVGVIARSRDDGSGYRWWLDGQARELRLERRLGGGPPFVIARTAIAGCGAVARFRRLALQVHGFRLEGWLDDAVVVQAFDGALTAGEPGLCWLGAPPEVRAIALAPPAERRSSAALVARGGDAVLHAGLPFAAGHHCIVELALDRPHALVPRDASGEEPWLLGVAASPRVALDDWRGSLAGGPRELPVGGTVAAGLAWRNARGIAGQAALVRVLVVDPGGGAVVGATAFVPVRF